MEGYLQCLRTPQAAIQAQVGFMLLSSALGAYYCGQSEGGDISQLAEGTGYPRSFLGEWEMTTSKLIVYRC